jgi:Cu(I)/Ag(I) efflux system periplasmic protein CusF
MSGNKLFTAILLSTSLMTVGLVSHSVLADSHEQHSDMMKYDHGRETGYMDGHGSKGRSTEGPGSMGHSVMGQGVINKVMAKARMISITHEPMKELDWPKMKMHFKVDESVDLAAIKPGQQVGFILQVMEGNNYLVSEITAK